MKNITLSKVQAKKLISELFRDIPDIYSGFKLMRDDLYALELFAEKQHRKGYAGSSKYNFPLSDTAKMWTIKHLFEGMQAANGETIGYTITDVLHIRFECIKAQAYAMENKEKLQAWHDAVKNSEFASLDYCELIK